MGGKVLAMLAIFLALPLVSADNLGIEIYKLEENGGKRFGNIDVRPGDMLDAFIEVENQNSDRSDETQEIDNIDIALTIEDILDDDDYEEDYSDFDLKPKKKENLPFSLDIPLRIEDTTFDILIEADGSQDGVPFFISTSFLLRIDKQKSDLIFETLQFQTDPLNCQNAAFLSVSIVNIGSSDEQATITISNPQVAYSTQQTVSVEKYPGDDTYRAQFPIAIPQIPSQKLFFDVSLRNSQIKIDKKVPLEIVCEEQDTQIPSNEDSSDQNLPDSEPNTQPTATQTQTTTQIQPPPIPIPQAVPTQTEPDIQFPLILPLVLLICIVLALILITLLKSR